MCYWSEIINTSIVEDLYIISFKLISQEYWNTFVPLEICYRLFNQFTIYWFFYPLHILSFIPLNLICAKFYVIKILFRMDSSRSVDFQAVASLNSSAPRMLLTNSTKKSDINLNATEKYDLLQKQPFRFICNNTECILKKERMIFKWNSWARCLSKF